MQHKCARSRICAAHVSVSLNSCQSTELHPTLVQKRQILPMWLIAARTNLAGAPVANRLAPPTQVISHSLSRTLQNAFAIANLHM